MGLALVLAACGGDGGGESTPQGTLTSFAPRANAIVGSEAMVQLASIEDPSALAVNVNGSKIDAKFSRDTAGRMLAMVTSLKEGANSVEVTSASGGSIAKLQLNSFPSSGPIFSGPQQQPWICETEKFPLPDGTFLPKSSSADCSVPTTVQYMYVNTASAFVPLPSKTSLPTDVVKTSTTEGKSVNFIVRIETGTLNRGIYQIAVLHDPTTDQEPSPWKSPPGWNGRLVYGFGGGCNAGYHQGQTVGFDGPALYTGVVRLNDLGRGYAVASSSLNVWSNNCNSVLSAETVSMVKERFIEGYGIPKYTIGGGLSGGSKAQFMIADAYPGLLDGILPSIQSGGPDGVTSNNGPHLDCPLLLNYFNNNATVGWTDGERTAVAGWVDWKSCPSGQRNYIIPTAQRPAVSVGCDPAIPQSQIYNAVINPTGVRCDIYTTQINQVGESSDHPGVGRSPTDNEGIQYGLKAFNDGAITADQFVELNERVGGYDLDGNYVAKRSSADPVAIRNAYRTGLAVSGNGGLNTTPIIDLRAYSENTGDLHDRYGSIIARERLRVANGNSDNLVNFTYTKNSAVPPVFSSPACGAPYFPCDGPFNSDLIANEALDQMSRWLDAIHADTSSDSLAVKVRKNKPSDLVDTCWDATRNRIVEPVTLDSSSKCNTFFPIHSEPRTVAGMPMAHNILKCQLKPINLADYSHPLSSAQLGRLVSVFPSGVCDYTKPGVEQQTLLSTWLKYPARGVAVPM
jgi:hypothetical protein